MRSWASFHLFPDDGNVQSPVLACGVYGNTPWTVGPFPSPILRHSRDWSWWNARRGLYLFTSLEETILSRALLVGVPILCLPHSLPRREDLIVLHSILPSSSCIWTHPRDILSLSHGFSLIGHFLLSPWGTVPVSIFSIYSIFLYYIYLYIFLVFIVFFKNTFAKECYMT